MMEYYNNNNRANKSKTFTSVKNAAHKLGGAREFGQDWFHTKVKPTPLYQWDRSKIGVVFGISIQFGSRKKK